MTEIGFCLHLLYIKILCQDVCRGDSGGSLVFQHEPGIDTIEAVVSGGVGKCAAGYPRWWIRVSAYRDWITCIMDGISKGVPGTKSKRKKDIERLCNFKEATKDQVPEKNLIFE